MEFWIAIGLGLWFLICGTISYIHVSKSFKKNDTEDKK